MQVVVGSHPLNRVGTGASLAHVRFRVAKQQLLPCWPLRSGFVPSDGLLGLRLHARLAAQHKRSGSASFCDALNAELSFTSEDGLRNSSPILMS